MRYVCVSAHTACVMRHVCHATLTMPPATPLSSTASNQEPRTGCIAQACSLVYLQGRKCTSFGAGIFVATMSTSDTDVLVCWRRSRRCVLPHGAQLTLTQIPRVAARVYSYFGNRGCVTDVTEMRLRRAAGKSKLAGGASSPSQMRGGPRPRNDAAERFASRERSRACGQRRGYRINNIRSC